MPLYRYYFLDSDGAVKDIRAIECRNDPMAITRARDFLAGQTGHVAVDLWRAEGFVGRIGPDGIIDNPPPPVRFRTPGKEN